MGDYALTEKFITERVEAACATIRAERDRQYEENVAQIMKYAALEAENERLLAALKEIAKWPGMRGSAIARAALADAPCP